VCDAAPLPALEQDEYVLDTPRVRRFVAEVHARIEAAGAPAEAVEAVRPLFAELIADREWLPEGFQRDAPRSGMGGGIGQWLLFRAADRSLCLFSLVVPPGSRTPVHDHLAWGLVGLYRGSQDEEIYRPGGGTLTLERRRPLVAGDFYALLPPRDDVHCVRTTSDVTSVSIHLLANDTGCVLRHAYDEVTGEARPFRSGYVNAPCEPEAGSRDTGAARPAAPA
jgi:predicted metal-dependent enzyme (double-stranded beta helix superfamily)